MIRNLTKDIIIAEEMEKLSTFDGSDSDEKRSGEGKGGEGKSVLVDKSNIEKFIEQERDSESGVETVRQFGDGK